ncbi:MAG: major intrinsic protein [Parcubacteria group bacterium Gr01-1014_33]|nr:MAG: major intrinsic protein [Parcubacteria group bacterium Gr01-1014_33]
MQNFTLKKYSAEFLGTFGLSFAVALSVSGMFPVPTPVIAGLTLGLFVYTIGHISGAHLNPAVTIGAWSLGKIKTRDAGFYIAAQFVGGALAYIMSHALIFPARLPVADTMWVGIAELIGTFFFTFGIAAVVYGRVPSQMSGAIVGGSLLLGISLASPLSNGILNPAVALGIGSFSLLYLIAPIIGAVAGMQAFARLSGER